MSKPEYTVSSGNIYADTGHPDAEELQIKAKLAREIYYAMQREGLTQLQVADRLGIDQPRVSALVRGKVGLFSVDRLRTFLNRMGYDVTITVRESADHREGRTIVDTGHESVVASAPRGEQVRFD